MPTNTELGLPLMLPEDASMRFLDWRNMINGDNKDAAFRKIDALLRERISVAGGGSMTMAEALGVGPYDIEFVPEDEGEITASHIGFNNAATGMTADNVQEAINELFAEIQRLKT